MTFEWPFFWLDSPCTLRPSDQQQPIWHDNPYRDRLDLGVIHPLNQRGKFQHAQASMCRITQFCIVTEAGSRKVTTRSTMFPTTWGRPSGSHFSLPIITLFDAELANLATWEGEDFYMSTVIPYLWASGRIFSWYVYSMWQPRFLIVTSAENVMFLPLSLCLSVHRITQKLSTNFDEIFGRVGWVTSKWLDCCGDLHRDAELGIFKWNFYHYGIE